MEQQVSEQGREDGFHAQNNSCVGRRGVLLPHRLKRVADGHRNDTNIYYSPPADGQPRQGIAFEDKSDDDIQRPGDKVLADGKYEHADMLHRPADDHDVQRPRHQPMHSRQPGLCVCE